MAGMTSARVAPGATALIDDSGSPLVDQWQVNANGPETGEQGNLSAVKIRVRLPARGTGMAVGDWHQFADGYGFYETLHGPLVEAQCDECAGVAYVVGYTGRVNEWGLAEDVAPNPIRCGVCLSRFHGRD